MSNEERKRRPRPESTIAQNFAADLDSMFGLILDPKVESLSKTIEEKKQTVTSGEQQLQELEARLRETEERLARVSRHSSPSRPTNTTGLRTDSDIKQTTDTAPRASPLAQKPIYPASRPATADDRSQAERVDAETSMPSISGAMPEAPQYSGSSEYVMVDRNAGQAQRGYG